MVESSFLLLPGEIRLQIYIHLFSSTTLHFTAPVFGPQLPQLPSYALAILLTCRTIYAESHTLWSSLCTLRFTNTGRFLDVLTPLPPAKVSLFRRIIVEKAHPLCLLMPGGGRFNPWPFHEALALLPGLQLEQLIVGDCWHDPELEGEPSWQEFGGGWNADRTTYKLVERLLKKSSGWRELRVFSPTSGMFCWMSSDNGLNGDRNMRWLQPAQWRRILQERDGKDLGQDVHIYRGNPHNGANFESVATWYGLGVSTPWTSWEQTQPTPGTGAEDMQGNVESSKRPNQRKPNVVVARRHESVSCMQDSSSLDPGLARRMHNQSWQQIKELGIFWDPRQDLSACCS